MLFSKKPEALISLRNGKSYELGQKARLWFIWKQLLNISEIKLTKMEGKEG